MGRRLVLRGPAHLRAQAVRRDPARGDARRRPLEVRPHEDGDDARSPTTRCARAATTATRASRTSSSTGPTARCRSRRSRASAARRSTRADDKELGLACVKAYNDWMVEEWCAPSGGVNIPLCIMPLWDVELAAAEIQRNADRGVRAFCFSELPAPPEAADDPQRRLGPGVPGVQRHRRDAVHAHRLVVDEPGRVARRARRRRRHARVQQLDGVARRLVVLGQAHRVPEAEARVLRGPDRLDPVRARAGRHGVGASTTAGSTRRSASPSRRRPTTTAASSAASPPTTTACTRSPRSARTTSASRPTTRTPTRRGRTRRSTSRRCSPTSTTTSPTRCCAATRSGCWSSTGCSACSSAPSSATPSRPAGSRSRTGSGAGRR